MGLAKANVDLENRRFTIWFSRKKGKNKNSHRTLAMTDQTYPIFERRMNNASMWLFPSARLKQRKNIDAPIVTLQKAHEAVVRQIGLQCRMYDFRHTFATRFALQPNVQLPTLSMILGHCDMDMLNRYVHPAQADMDRAMAAFSNYSASPEMLVDFAA